MYKLIFFVILIYPHCVLSDNMPGTRPDLSPGLVASLFTSTESRVIRSLGRVREIERRRTNELSNAERDHRQALSKLRERMESAPEDALVRTTRAGFQNRINRAIVEHQDKLAEINDSFDRRAADERANLRNLLSSPFNDEQVIMLDERPQGDVSRGIVENFVAAQNINLISNRLVERYDHENSSPSDAENIYADLLELYSALLDMHLYLVAYINNDLLVRIARISERQERHRNRIMSDSGLGDERREVLLSNYRTDKDNIDSFKSYLHNLRAQSGIQSTIIRRHLRDLELMRESAVISALISSESTMLVQIGDVIEFELLEPPMFQSEVLRLE